MSNLIFCHKLNEEAEQMKTPPFPGELGNRLFNQISQKAWEMWLSHQTMLINEYRLNLADATARAFLRTEMENYLFGDGSKQPDGFIEPK